jgi:AcrR family transcriptional regulator
MDSGPRLRRSYGGASAEERVAERRARLMEAGLELLGTAGLHGITVRGVIEQARLTPRYFYESFPDLDSLIVEVYDAVVAEVRDASVAALLEAPKDTRARVHAVITTIVNHFGDDPRKGRLVLAEAMASPALMRRRLDTSHMFADLMSGRAVGHEASPELTLAARFIVGGFAEALNAWLHDGLETDRRDLVDGCTMLFMATLEAATARTPHP